MGGAGGREATAGGHGAPGGAKRRTERARSDRGPSPGGPGEAEPPAPEGGRAGGGRRGISGRAERSGGRAGRPCRPENANGAAEWRPASPARGRRRHGRGEKRATTVIV